MNAYPIFRLAISLAAGIFFAETFRTDFGVFSVLLLLLLLIGLGYLLKQQSFQNRWLFGAGVSAFMFVVGMMLTENEWRKVEVDWPDKSDVYRGIVQEVPQAKPKTYQCRVELEDGRHIWIYLPKDSASVAVEIGDELLFDAHIEVPYASYLYYRGISGTAYVPRGAWEKTSRVAALTLKQKALSFREKMIQKYKQWGVGDEQMPVLCALTLGYKGDLDKQTRDAYSVAGISHVLALSGMHIGILWLLLDFLLKPLVVLRLGWLRSLLITGILWGFAFVVGLEASVVRAVWMCMLAELGRLSGSRPLSIHTLSIAAFFMLMYHPFYLFDVSFQLSFVAVASILLLYPILFKVLSPKNRLMRWGWGVTAMSVAAQLGTAPLVMYYFSNFSVYFLMANLAVSVLVPLILYVAVLMVVFAPLSSIQQGIVWCLNGLVDGLNGLAECTSGLPGATFSLQGFGVMEVLTFYTLLLFVVLFAKDRRPKWLISALVALFSMLALRLFVLCR